MLSFQTPLIYLLALLLRGSQRPAVYDEEIGEEGTAPGMRGSIAYGVYSGVKRLSMWQTACGIIVYVTQLTVCTAQYVACSMLYFE